MRAQRYPNLPFIVEVVFGPCFKCPAITNDVIRKLDVGAIADHMCTGRQFPSVWRHLQRHCIDMQLGSQMSYDVDSSLICDNALGCGAVIGSSASAAGENVAMSMRRRRLSLLVSFRRCEAFWHCAIFFFPASKDGAVENQVPRQHRQTIKGFKPDN